MSTENYGKFAALLDASLQHVHTAGPTDSFTPGRMVPVEITVKSNGGEFDLRLTESYPAEIELYDAETGQRITENPRVIEVALGSDETKTVLYYALAPAEAGTYKLQTTVEYREAGTYRYFTDVYADIKVKKSAEEITGDIIAALQALFVTGRDSEKVTKAINSLQNVMGRTATNTKDIQKNIHDILIAINAALTVDGADMTDIRLMMDGLLEIWEVSWYMDELGL